MERFDLPFTEKGDVRTFSKDVAPDELKWHWDEQDRIVTVLHDTDWMFQFDDELPIRMIYNQQIQIRAGVWHRLIKGHGDLVLGILKCKTKHPIRP